MFSAKEKHKISPAKFFEIEGAVLLDVRSKEEAESIAIKMKYHPNIQCINIPINKIRDRIIEIPEGKPIGVLCSGIVRSAITYAYLLSKGFSDIRILEGGYSGLTEALKPGKLLSTLQKGKEGVDAG